MRKTISVLTVLFLLGFYVHGCSTLAKTDRADRQTLRTLAGGAAGALVTWNVGGAIIGAFVMDVVNITAIKYEDKKIESGEEAARRYNDKIKAEKKKEDGKEASQIKSIDKKAEQKKEEDEEASQIKSIDKKAEQKKEEDKRVQLIIENSSVAKQTVTTGATIEANVQYVLLAAADSNNIKITETRILWSANKKIELAEREVVKTPGTYLTAIKFKMPDEIPKGYCILLTTISTGKQTKTTRSVINII